MSLAYDAMMFARHIHAAQVRKYTGNPYADHLAEVTGIVSTVTGAVHESVSPEEMIATAWLHDSIEDQEVTLHQIQGLFGKMVAKGVLALSDLEKGNRAQRKAASCIRLGAADGWIQTIKLADMISNTSSIVKHDPNFAAVYLQEKRALLDVLTNGDSRLHAMASDILKKSLAQLEE